MNKILLVAVFAFLSAVSYAQNIVPNSNFKLFHECPNLTGDIVYCVGITNPTSSTPDYYSDCNDTFSLSTHNMGLPDNVAGSQSSLSGAYLGLSLLQNGPASAVERDYVSIGIPSLEVGKTYRVSMVVSLADEYKVATRAPSVLFSVSALPYMNIRTNMPYEPQVTFANDGIISDKINWVTVSDTIVADSSYGYMTLGNFLDSAETPQVPITDGTVRPVAYYYIDSIAVEKIEVSGVGTVAGGVDVYVAPNPAHGMVAVHVGGAATSDYTMEIRSVTGSVVRSRVLHGGGAHDVDISELAPGMYLYTLRDRAGNAGYGKLMVE